MMTTKCVLTIDNVEGADYLFDTRKAAVEFGRELLMDEGLAGLEPGDLHIHEVRVGSTDEVRSDFYAEVMKDA